MTHTEQFDKQLSGLVNEDRMRDYGHPADHFASTAEMKKVLARCPDPVLRHVLEMIGDKLVRLCQSPEHLDSWIDVAGYARTAVMVLDKRNESKITVETLQVGSITVGHKS